MQHAAHITMILDIATSVWFDRLLSQGYMMVFYEI